MPSVQLKLFEEQRVGRRPGEFEGRSLGALEVTTPDRLQEVARLVVQGWKPGEIGRALGITQVRASGMVVEAKAQGLVDVLQAGRNQTIKEMTDRRRGIAERGLAIVKKRLDGIQRKQPSKIDARDMKDTFEALDITEHTKKGSKDVEGGGRNGPSVVLAVFPPDVLRRAAQASAEVLDV